MIIDIDGLNINYVVEGEGSEVLLLHGWGCSTETVMPIFNLLKKNFKVYAIDFPGFGKSDKPKKVFSGEDYAKIVYDFMNKLKMRKVVIIGHSFGGKISIILGSKYKNIIDKIVLIDSAGLIPKRTIKYYIKVYSFKILKLLYKSCFSWGNKDKAMKKFQDKFGSEDYKNSSGIMRQIFVKAVNENFEYLLRDIEAPTLIIWGEKDTATPLYMGERMKREIKDSGLVVFEGAGHYSYIEDFRRFSIVLNAFLLGGK